MTIIEKERSQLVDPLYELLERFTREKGVSLPAVNLDSDELDELRRLLLEWDTGAPDAPTLIVELYSLPPEANS